MHTTQGVNYKKDGLVVAIDHIGYMQIISGPGKVVQTSIFAEEALELERGEETETKVARAMRSAYPGGGRTGQIYLYFTYSKTGGMKNELVIVTRKGLRAALQRAEKARERRRRKLKK